MIEAVLRAGCRAIIQGEWENLDGIRDYPQIFKIGNVPHGYIFPQCSAVVHHGGAGTTHTAMLHGCPSVIIEHFGDQAYFAYELHRLGVAPKALHRKYSQRDEKPLGACNSRVKKRAEDLQNL
jgi:UDP:flavonoid glycosyltransferase YjiC (YdhE family)